MGEREPSLLSADRRAKGEIGEGMALGPQKTHVQRILSSPSRDYDCKAEAGGIGSRYSCNAEGCLDAPYRGLPVGSMR